MLTDGRTDETGIKKLIVAFRFCERALKNYKCITEELLNRSNETFLILASIRTRSHELL
jgi:hypothetical protein